MGRLVSEEVAGMGRGGLAGLAGPVAPGLGALLIKRNATCCEDGRRAGCEDGRRGGRGGEPEAGSVLIWFWK